MSAKNRPPIVIVGAGLAGFAAGILLARRGQRVVIIEKNAYIGGRTASWQDDGMAVESGLHRFLGFYTALPKLLQQAGVSLNDDVVIWEDEIEIRPVDGPSAIFALSPLGKPFATLGSVLGNNDFINFGDKLALAGFFVKLLTANKTTLEPLTIHDLAKQSGVRPQAEHRVLVALTDGIFFLPPEVHGAWPMAQLARAAAKRPHRIGIGAFRGGMSDVMMQPLRDHFEALGGQVRTGAAVERLHVAANHGVDGVILDGRHMPAAHVVVAASIGAAKTLLRPLVSHHSWLRPVLGMPMHPAVTLQCELEHPLTNVDRTTFGPGSMISCFAEQSRTTFTHAKGRVSIIMSNPQQFLDTPASKLLAVVREEFSRLGLTLPKVTAYRKISHPADFYRLVPGVEDMRPTQATSIPGLTLAGDYTRQPYAATMEGAVVSGELAAHAVIKATAQ